MSSILVLIFFLVLVGCQKKDSHEFYEYTEEGETLLFEFKDKEKGVLYISDSYNKVQKGEFVLNKVKFKNEYTIAFLDDKTWVGIGGPRIRFEGGEMYFLQMGIDWDSDKVMDKIKAKKINSKDGEKRKKKIEELVKKIEKEYTDKEKATMQKINFKKKEMDTSFQVLKEKLEERNKNRDVIIEKNKNIEKILGKELKELKEKSKEDDKSAFVRTLFMTYEIRKKEYVDFVTQVERAEAAGDMKELETDFMYVEKSKMEILELIHSLENKSVQEKEEDKLNKYQEKIYQELEVEHKKIKEDMEQIKKNIIPAYEIHNQELEKMKYEAEQLRY